MPKTEWPLHLKRGPAGTETEIRQNLPATLGELADLTPGFATPLRAAQTSIEAAIRAFPDRSAIIAALLAAADALEPIAADEALKPIAHRLRRKLIEIDAALLLAAGLAASAWAEPNRPAPGGSSTLNISIGPVPFSATPMAGNALHVGSATIADGIIRHSITVNSEAPLSTLYPASFSSLGGNGELALAIEATIGNRIVRGRLDLDEPFSIGPAFSVELLPEAVILPSGRTNSSLPIGLRSSVPTPNASLIVPAAWGAMRTEAGFAVIPPLALPDGLYRLPLMIEGRQAYRQVPISYPHIGHAQFVAPQALNVLVLGLALPASARIGYVGGGSDRVGFWLRAMGLDVIDLDANALDGDLSGLTTIVVGTFAFGARPDLAAATGKLRNWVEAGGHLLTLYHRPSDGWTPDTTPPRRIVIGSPSLRWRVTDPAAQVDILAPDHKLLTGPNAIGPDDWAGWDKERGLYFAAEWDGAYEPLLTMHDAGEKPLIGALISAPIGKGRHTHTSLVLHHQLDRLVPGAFRLLANLVQPA